jgi:arsenate reductase
MGEVEDKIENFEKQDIKKKPMNEEEIEMLYNYFGSYVEIFNKRAQKYKTLGLKGLIKNDKDYKQFLLMDYTFLKRPVFVVDNKIFVGNSKSTIEELKQNL